MSELTFLEVELEVLIMVTTYTEVFWDVTPCIMGKTEVSVIRFI